MAAVCVCVHAGGVQLDAETKAWLVNTYMDSGPYVNKSRVVTGEEEEAVRSKQDRRRSVRMSITPHYDEPGLHMQVSES